MDGAQNLSQCDGKETVSDPIVVNSDNFIKITNQNSLIWVTACLNGQRIPAMVDSGANPNCLSLRCVQGSHQLKQLEKFEYSGKQVVDANGEPIEPSFVIKCELKLGTPSIILEVEFLVIKSLPFSCILGQSTLQTFSSWEVSNTNKILTINKNIIVPFHDCGDTSTSGINLITSQKVSIPPYSSTLVDVRASGSGLDQFRPETSVSVIVEGNQSYCERLSLEVIPSVNVLNYQNCSQRLKVHNLSSKTKSIAKGVKLATCTSDYEICGLDESIGVNSLSEIDPIDYLCQEIKDLSQSELKEARSLLSSYKDVFTVSSQIIGNTNIQTFDIDNKNMPPVTVPLRRIPLHHRDVVRQLIDKYEQLHLLEPIESPFRASTVLVRKKNPSKSTEVSDMYRLCTDYRMLNNNLTSSGWPSPSLDDCLDAIGDSDMFSSIDFNNGYFQIPCSKRAKQVLAFSPGYGFKQYTWTVMPQGVKTASSCFQQSMDKTFSGHEHCILPPFYDDVTIRSKGFKEHLQNLKIILDDVRAANFTLNALKCKFFS